MQVANNAVVAIRYRLRNNNGETLESIMEKGPVQYVQGSGAVLPSLEVELLGLEAGDTKTIYADDFYVEVVVDAVRPATLQEIKANNFQNPYPVEQCGPDCIC
jgi:FKBP-type peptidyl-prolyl cis-trans isomerase SlyD